MMLDSPIFCHWLLQNVLFLKAGFKHKAPIDLSIKIEGGANVFQDVVELLQSSRIPQIRAKTHL